MLARCAMRESQQSVAFWKIIPSSFLQRAGTNCPLLQLPAIKLMPPIAKVAHRQADSALSGFREQVNMPIPSHLAATANANLGVVSYTRVSYEATYTTGSVYGSINMLYVHVFPTAGAIRDPLANGRILLLPLAASTHISLPGKPHHHKLNH